MSIRTEVEELEVELTEFGILLTDDISNMTQIPDIGSALVKIVKESADFKNIPKGERKKAISSAFISAGVTVLNETIEYSDEDDEEE